LRHLRQLQPGCEELLIARVIMHVLQVIRQSLQLLLRAELPQAELVNDVRDDLTRDERDALLERALRRQRFQGPEDAGFRCIFYERRMRLHKPTGKSVRPLIRVHVSVQQ